MKEKLCRLSVTFINDEFVLKVLPNPINGIKSLESYGLLKALQRKSNNEKVSLNRCSSSNILSPLPEESSVITESEVFFKPTAIVENESPNGKEQVFGFRTPSKASKFKELKSEDMLASSPKTPTNSKSTRTPKSKCRTPNRSINGSPAFKSKRRLSTPKRIQQKSPPLTPYTLRKKVKKQLSKASNIEQNSDDELYDDSDLDGHYSPSGSDANTDSEFETDDFVDINYNNTPAKMLRGLMKKGPQTPMRTPRRGRLHKVDVDMVASSEDYFSHNSDPTSCITSDHTLNRLENPRLGPDVLKSILQDVHESHQQEKSELFEDHCMHFHHWMTLLLENFSVFLCGVGSKKNLLSLFQKEILQDVDHVVLNGFFPSLTIKSILVTILGDILCLKSIPQGTSEQLHLLQLHYDNVSTSPLILVINNLDGPMLRPEKSQYVLSQLASFKNVHVIASIDHINAPLIFDASKSSFYNPVWFDVTTLAPYSEETSYENSLMVQQSGALALSSLIHVFKSLTPNAKGIFLLLAKFQFDQKDNSNYNGMSLHDLYQRCRERFLVNSDLTLRAQLTEFRDHKLIKIKHNHDAAEYLVIPLDPSTLEEFMADHAE